MVTWKALHVKNYLLVIRMNVAAGTRWGASWGMERVCGRGGIRKTCGKVLKGQKPQVQIRYPGHPAEQLIK
jgi:hypothetical protein